MGDLKYLSGFPEPVIRQVRELRDSGNLGNYLSAKYPVNHEIKTDRELYDYTVEMKKCYLKKSRPLSKVVFDPKIKVVSHALGTHTFVSRVQGNNLKAKNEIRIASVFRSCPEAFLRMIVVHELAHLKEKDHNKAFYKLCEYMEPDYFSLELDTRIFLLSREEL